MGCPLCLTFLTVSLLWRQEGGRWLGGYGLTIGSAAQLSPLPYNYGPEVTTGWSSTDNIYHRAVSGQVGPDNAAQPQWRSMPWMPVAVVEPTSYPPAQARATGYSGTWAGLFSRPTVASRHQQPASPSRQPVPSYGYGQRQLGPESGGWGAQNVWSSQQAVPSSGFGQREQRPEPGGPGDQHVWSSRQTVPPYGYGRQELGPELGGWSDQHVLPPRQAVPTPVRVSLKTVAEEASVLLELFSQSIFEGDDDAISLEHRELIVTVAAGISTIQPRLHQCTDQGTRNNEVSDADCTVCLANKADVVFLPCKHLVVCNVRITWAPLADLVTH